jgi:hypothetical protein
MKIWAKSRRKLLLLVAVAELETVAVAGPHHWRSWTQGVITGMDAERRILIAQASGAPTATRYRWDSRTRLWDLATARRKGRPVNAGALSAGETVRIWTERVNGEGLAVRILIGPAANRNERATR